MAACGRRMTTAIKRPLGDPPTDSLTTLADAERDAALRRFEALRPHPGLTIDRRDLQSRAGHVHWLDELVGDIRQ